MFKNKLIERGERNIVIKRSKLLIGNKAFSLEELQEMGNKKEQHRSQSSSQGPNSLNESTPERKKPGRPPGPNKRHLQADSNTQKDSPLLKYILQSPTLKRVKQDE